MSFTNFLETEILDHVFAGAAYSAPGTHYLALYTAAPGETGGGTEVTTSGTAYAHLLQQAILHQIQQQLNFQLQQHHLVQ